MEEKLAAVDLASHHYRQAGHFHNAVRTLYGISTIRFWQLINRLIQDPDVIAQRPIQCRHLRDVRDERARRRVRHADTIRTDHT